MTLCSRPSAPRWRESAPVSRPKMPTRWRAAITEAGHGDHFGHGLGHGVGLAIHEGPTLSPREEATLEAGMVVTVEPGVYLPGWGGVRIEDLVVITPDGCDDLTAAPKHLMEL